MFSTAKISHIGMFGQNIWTKPKNAVRALTVSIFLSLFLAFHPASGQSAGSEESAAEESQSAGGRPVIILQSQGPAAEAAEGGQLAPPEEEMTEEEKKAIEGLMRDMKERIDSFITSAVSAIALVLSEEGHLAKESSPSNQFVSNLVVTDILQQVQTMFLVIFSKRGASISQKREALEALTGALDTPSKYEDFKAIVKGQTSKENIIQSIFLDSSRTQYQMEKPVLWEANQIFAVQEDEALISIPLTAPHVSVLNRMLYEKRKKAEEDAYQSIIIDELEKIKPQGLGINMDINHHSFGLMRLGNYIREKGLDLHIFGYCGSPCSRYLLPAARNIHIGPYGVIFYEGAAPSMIARDLGGKIDASANSAMKKDIKKIESFGGPVEYLYSFGDKRGSYLKRFVSSMLVYFQQVDIANKLIENILAYHKKQVPFNSLSASEVSSLFVEFSPEELQLLAGFLSENLKDGADSGAEESAAGAERAPENFYLAQIENKEEWLKSRLKSGSEAAFDKFSSALRKLRESKASLDHIAYSDFKNLFAEFSSDEMEMLSAFLVSTQYKFFQRDALFKGFSQTASEELEFFANLKNPAYVDFLRFSHSLVKYDPSISAAFLADGSEMGDLKEADQNRSGYYVVPSADLLRKAGLNIVEGENQAENLSPNDLKSQNHVILAAEQFESCVRFKDKDGYFGESARKCALAIRP